MKNKVTIHSEEPLNFLLCGPAPLITNRRPASKSRDFKKKKTQFDMTGFPKPITSLKTKTKTKDDVIRYKKSKKDEYIPNYIKIRNDRTFIKTIENNLSTYNDNHKRRVSQIHQDWEENYVHPFNERMKSQLNGEIYKSYKTSKKRAFTSMGELPKYSTLNLDPPIDVPTLKISTSGLNDKVHIFSKNESIERKLTCEVCGIDRFLPAPASLKSTEELMSLQRETRFYSENSNNSKSGRKYYTGVNKSTVYDEIHNIN